MNPQNSRGDAAYRSMDQPSLVSDVRTPVEHDVPLSPAERAVYEEEWRTELARLEGEISTLKSVLGAKTRQADEIKRRLGITPLAELRKDFQHSVQTIRESESFQKTNQKLHQIGETISTSDAYKKTNSALRSFGSFASRKLGDFRNSNMFKSVEEKVGGAYSSVKSNLSMSQSANNVNNAPTSPVDSLLDDDEVYSQSLSSRNRSGSK